AIRVMESTKNEPDSFVASLLGEELIQKNETELVNTLVGHGFWQVPLDSRLDVREIQVVERFVEALDLEVVDFFVAKIAILISIAEVENTLQRGDAGRLQRRVFGVEQRRYWICDSFLTQIEDFVDVVMLSSARSNTGIDLLKF
ncbi:MAG: hypothetical protein Q9213_004960, partial [Squamulea squamosa]